MENRNNQARPYQNRGQQKPRFQQREFLQRPEFSCLGLKILITMRRYSAEKNFNTMHYAIFEGYVLATMAGVKTLPKDILQQVSASLGKYSYKMIRLDATRYAVMRMPHVDQHWTKLGSKRASSLPNDFAQLTEMLDTELTQAKAE